MDDWRAPLRCNDDVMRVCVACPASLTVKVLSVGVIMYIYNPKDWDTRFVLRRQTDGVKKNLVIR